MRVMEQQQQQAGQTKEGRPKEGQGREAPFKKIIGWPAVAGTPENLTDYNNNNRQPRTLSKHIGGRGRRVVTYFCPQVLYL